jgi:hypothetical protein
VVSSFSRTLRPLAVLKGASVGLFITLEHPTRAARPPLGHAEVAMTHGGAGRENVTVSKTVMGRLGPSRVRIPPSPLPGEILCLSRTFGWPRSRLLGRPNVHTSQCRAGSRAAGAGWCCERDAVGYAGQLEDSLHDGGTWDHGERDPVGFARGRPGHQEVQSRRVEEANLAEVENELVKPTAHRSASSASTIGTVARSSSPTGRT